MKLISIDFLRFCGGLCTFVFQHVRFIGYNLVSASENRIIRITIGNKHSRIYIYILKFSNSQAFTRSDSMIYTSVCACVRIYRSSRASSQFFRAGYRRGTHAAPIDSASQQTITRHFSSNVTVTRTVHTVIVSAYIIIYITHLRKR